jgi:hypothetical protein
MTTITAALLALLFALPRYHQDTESEMQRVARLTTVASSIALVSERATCTGAYASKEGCKAFWPGSVKELQRLLITQAYFETGLAQHVHEGRCRRNECDGGRARGLWQVQRSGLVPWEQWERIKGADEASTRISAYYAARALSRGYNKCGTIEGAIAIYATGATCTWAGASKRFQFFERLMAKD